jgi:hypothetical protein
MSQLSNYLQLEMDVDLPHHPFKLRALSKIRIAKTYRLYLVISQQLYSNRGNNRLYFRKYIMDVDQGTKM